MKKVNYHLTEDQQKLVENNLKLVPFTVHRFMTHIAMEIDEMISIGYMGLCVAAHNYDPSSGNAFSTFAIKYIIGFIMQQVNHNLQPVRHNANLQTINFGSYENIDAVESSFADKKLNNRFEAEAIDGIVFKRIWDEFPTLKEIYKNDKSEVMLAHERGVTRQRIHTKKKEELEKAKAIIENIGIENVA